MVLAEAQAESQRLGGAPIAIVDSGGRIVKSAMFIGQRCMANTVTPGVHTLALGPGYRPYIAGHKPDARVWRKYKPKPAQIVFTHDEQEYISTMPRRYVVIEPHVKQLGSGKGNKNWGFERYQKVVKKLPEIAWLQMGNGSLPKLDGVHYVQTANFRQACAVLSKAIGYLGPEGGLHHAAAAVKVPAVVIFGGYISPEVTGYDSHVNLYTGDGLGCGRHAKCECNCMARITEDQVAQAVKQMLNADLL